MRCLLEEHSTFAHLLRVPHLIAHISRASPSPMVFEVVGGFGTHFHLITLGFDYFILTLKVSHL